MIEENKAPANERIEDNETCCSNAACCAPQSPIKRLTPKVGRNEPCPCDSGSKFKKCCGQYM